MADLKLPKSSTSNKKIVTGLGGLFAFIAYMRSFWSDGRADAHTAGENLREDAEEVYLISEVPDISEWRAEIAQKIPADKATNTKDHEGMVVDPLFKIKSSGLFLPEMPNFNLSQVFAPGPAMLAPGTPPLVPATPPLVPITPAAPVTLIDLAGSTVSENNPVDGPEIADPLIPAEVLVPGPAMLAPGTPPLVPATPPLVPITPAAPVTLIDSAGSTESENNPVDGPEIADPINPVEFDPATLELVASEPPLLPELPCDALVGSGTACGDSRDCAGLGQIAPETATDRDSCADETCAVDEALHINRLVVEGTIMSDTLSGTDAAEEILGFSGADRIDGMGGDDVIVGGTGGDDLAGGGGDDALMGGDDDDRLTGGAGADLVMGEAGDDVVDGGAGDDLLLGGIGADTIFGRDGDDRLLGGDGDDVLHDGSGRDVLLGGFGDDTIHLFADVSADFVNGGDGFDRLDLTAAQLRSRTDIALGEVQIDDGPANQFVGVEGFVAGAAADEFDFSGLAAANPDSDAPMFFQITNFSRGDTVRVTESFAIGFDDFANDRLWVATPDAGSELEARMREANGDTADAVPSRLLFRSATEEGMVARAIDFDFDDDGHVDFALIIQGNLSEDPTQFSDQA